MISEESYSIYDRDTLSVQSFQESFFIIPTTFVTSTFSFSKPVTKSMAMWPSNFLFYGTNFKEQV